MGRYLALGITSKILLKRKRNNWGGISEFDFKKNEQEVKQGLSKLLDITQYNISADEEEIYLEIKPEHFNNNIHDLIKELNPLIYCSECLETFEEEIPANSIYLCSTRKEIELNNDFNKENYPLTIRKCEEDTDKHHKGCIYSEWNDFEEWIDSYAAPEYWLFDNKELIDQIDIKIAYILIWQDWDKISSEDETKLLAIMNTMSRKYYSSPLSKNMLFFIFG